MANSSSQSQTDKLDRNQRLFQAVPLAAYIWQKRDADFVLVDYNQAAMAITNGHIVDFIGQTARQLYQQDDPQLIQDIATCFTTEQTFTRDYLYNFRSTGETHDLKVTYTFVAPDSVVVFTEELPPLQRQQRQLASALDQTADSVFITNKQGVIEYTNAAFTTVTGYTAAAAIGQTPRILQSGEHDATFFDNMWRTILAGRPFRGTLINQRRNGELYYEDRTITPLTNEQGEITHFVAAGRDITAQKKQAEAIQEREARYKSLLDALPDMMFVLDQAGTLLDYHAHDGATLYATPDKFLGKPVQDVLPPDAVATIMPAVAETLQQSGIHHFEYTLELPQRLSYFDARAVKSGLNEVLIVVRDITAHKEVQHTLQQSSQLNQAILDSIPAHIAMLNKEGHIIATNAAWNNFGRQNGAPLESIGIGSNYLAVSRRAAAVDDDARSLLWGIQAIQEGRSDAYQMEYPCHSPTSRHWFLQQVVPVNGDGALLISHTDITEQKYLERQLIAIYSLGQELIRLENESVIINRLLTMLMSLYTYELVGIGLIDPQGNALVYQHQLFFNQLQQLEARFALDGNISIGTAVAQTGEAIYLPDVTQDSRYVPYTSAHKPNWQADSAYCIPIIASEKVLGVVNLESSRQDGFTHTDRRLLQIMANQIGQALQNARLFNTEKRQAKNLRLLNQASQLIVASLDLDDVLEQLIEHVKQVLQAKTASILLLDDSQTHLYFAAVAGDDADSQMLLNSKMGPDESIASWVLHHKTSVRLDDAQQDPRFYNGIDKLVGQPTRSLLAVPLIFQNEALGVVEVLSSETAVFKPEDQQLLEALAASAAIAVVNARVFQQEKTMRKQLENLHQTGLLLTASLDLNRVLQAIIAGAFALTGGASAHIFLYDTAADSLTFGAAIDGTGPRTTPYVQPRPNGLTYTVARRGELIAVTDIEKSQLTDSRNGQLRGSMVGLPIKARGEVIGVLILHQPAPNTPFWQARLQTLTLLADQAAIAIENARLFATEQQQRQQLQRSQNQLLQAEKMSALGRLTASIAHEINNPLQAVQGFVTLTRETVQEAPQLPPDMAKIPDYLQIVEDEVDRVAGIVQKMRDFYRPAQQNKQEIDVQAILQSILTLSRKKIEHQDVIINEQWATNLPPVLANPDHLKQVFLNLLLNALDAMPEGGELRIHTRRDQFIRDGQSVPAVRIDFNDTGVGMPPHIIETLFEPFVTTKSSGTGLGLSISFGLIEAQGGTMQAESKLGAGSTLTVFLPS